MSTPSGIRLNPFDLSDGVSHETHERADPERRPIETDNWSSGDVAPLAPLAPLRASEGLCGEPEGRPVDVHEPCLFSHDAADGLRAPGQLFDKQKQEQPSAVSCDEIIRDLERLAHSVRWVQRTEAA